MSYFISWISKELQLPASSFKIRWFANQRNNEFRRTESISTFLLSSGRKLSLRQSENIFSSPMFSGGLFEMTIIRNKEDFPLLTNCGIVKAIPVKCETNSSFDTYIQKRTPESTADCEIINFYQPILWLPLSSVYHLWQISEKYNTNRFTITSSIKVISQINLTFSSSIVTTISCFGSLLCITYGESKKTHFSLVSVGGKVDRGHFSRSWAK